MPDNISSNPSSQPTVGFPPLDLPPPATTGTGPLPPAVGDSIESSPTTVITQNIHISGNPAAPSVPPPLTDAQIQENAKSTFGSTKTILQSTAELNNNPYFNVSFTAVISVIMNAIAGMNNFGALIEALAELKTRFQALEMAYAKGELTKASYNAQAQELRNNALNSFLSAALAGASLVMTARNAVKAEKAHGSLVEGEKAQIADMEKAPPTTGPGSNPFATKPTRAELAANTDYVAAKKSLSNLQTFGGKAGSVSQHQQHYDQMTKTATDMLTQVVSGMTSSANASIKTREGELESLKTALDALIKALQDHQGRIDESRKGLMQGVDSALDFSKKVADSNIHHSAF